MSKRAELIKLARAEAGVAAAWTDSAKGFGPDEWAHSWSIMMARAAEARAKALREEAAK